MPAIFLDRDGVIIENRDNYVRSWNDVYIYPQALTALTKFKNVPYKFVIVTNQSVVGRGLLSKEDANTINFRLVREIEHTGGRIDAVFMCPHAPVDMCNCRKPNPGMFIQASKSLSINLYDSIMIGDALTDIAAAQSAGIKQRILVRTGRGDQQSKLKETRYIFPFSIYDTIYDAFNHIFL